jgi:2-methylcitrate dehydratase PrpD
MIYSETFRVCHGNKPFSYPIMSIAETLSKFTAEITSSSIPAVTVTRAKHLILDAVGIAFASGKFEFARCALDGIAKPGTGDSTVIGFSEKLALRDAALMNGLLIHGLDYDDTYLPGSMHLTASNVPAAIAMAAHGRASGSELLTACTLGLEIGARLAGAAKGGFQKSGFHATGICAAFSCALVAGRLMRLPPAQLTMAQGIALSTASGSMQPLRDGSWTKRMHGGWAASAGITAACMASSGYVAPVEAYEGHFGFYPLYLGSNAAMADPALITQRLGEQWELERASIKLYPAGHLTHAFMTATLKLMREHHIQMHDVQSVLARVGANAIPLVCEPVALKHRPTTSYAAQFSLQYGIACCIARRRFGLNELEASAFDDPALHALAAKVAYEVDPDSGFPKFRSGEVEIRLNNGTSVRQREVINPDTPESNADIVTKFMGNACLVMPEQRAQALREMILNVEQLTDARENLAMRWHLHQEPHEKHRHLP